MATAPLVRRSLSHYRFAASSLGIVAGVNRTTAAIGLTYGEAYEAAVSFAAAFEPTPSG